jgi:hypothetical protein
MSDDRTPSPTPRYNQVLDASMGVAREMGHSHVGVEHLFLAIIGDQAAIPTQVLARISDLDQVEARLRELMASPGYAGEPPAGAVWFPLSELPDFLRAVPRCIPPGTQYGFNVAEDQAWIIVHEPGDTAAAVASARALIEQERH